jgi:hypothetical protein
MTADTPPTSNRTGNRILLILAALIVVALLVLAFAPIPLTLRADDHDADLTFNASRQFVWGAGTCVTVTWNTERIDSIYLDGEPVIGFGEETACVNPAAMPTFTVNFPNTAEETYTIQPIILSQTGWFYGLGALAFVLAMLAIVPRRTAGRVARSVELAAIWIIITFVLLEIGMRVFIATTGTEADRLAYLGTNAEIQEANAIYIELPYLVFGLSPAQADVNTLGYRGDPITTEKPPGTYRVVALGGSTTHGYILPSEEAWPALLEDELREGYGYDNVEIINAGVPGYTSWNSYINLSLRVLELDPDLIIIYHAINDSISMHFTSDDCWRGENPNLGLGSGSFFADEAPTLPPSAFYRYFAVRFGVIPNPVVQRAAGDPQETRIRRGVCDPASGTEVTPEDYSYFERNLRNSIVVAREHDVDVMLATWVHGYSTLGESVSNPFLKVTFDLNDIVRALSDEYDTYLVDPEIELEANWDYWLTDGGIHQTVEGTQRMAEIFAAAFEEQGVIADDR